jgi:hypothetical protein
MMAKPKTTVPESSPRQFSAELIARSMEWQNLAAKLEQRAEAWREEAVGWERHRDDRASISSYRVQWTAEQTHQLAAWLRLASDHLAALAAQNLH